MRNAVIVFTKVPKAGITKTRLTTDRGGILTPQEAMEIYEGCFLDVVNVCLSAGSGDVYICYNHGGDPAYLEEVLSRCENRQAIREVYPDQGGNFDQCMQYAADYILKDGKEDRLADSVVIVGGDLPSFQPSILQDSVRKMEEMAKSAAGKQAGKGNGVGAALVEGACQEGGFSLVGYTCATPFDFDRVFYNVDGITALDMLLLKAADQAIPFGVVEAAPDVDIPVDLASIMPVIKALRMAAVHDKTIKIPVNTLAVLEKIGLESASLPPAR